MGTGWYLIGGAGYANGKTDWGNGNDSKGDFYWCGGAGWMFAKNMGLEAKFNSAVHDSITASFIFRF